MTEENQPSTATSAQGSVATPQPPSLERDESSSSIPPLPKTVDVTGDHYETPSWTPLVKFSASIVLPIVLAILMFATGHAWEGVGFLVIAVLFTIGFLFVGFRFSDSTLKALHKGALTPGEEAALTGSDPAAKEQAERVEALGGLLGRQGRGAFAVFSAALEPDAAATIEANRAAEADATLAWLTTAGQLERVTTQSDDGLHLVGHVLRCAPDSKRWVLLAHGYNGSWNEMMLYARHYAEKGFNLFMPEMRGHGDSEGDWIGMGWPDRLDLTAWAKWLVGREGDDIEVVLHGHSMGAASVCLASAEESLPRQVKVAVSDCSYTDAINTFRDVVANGMGMSPHPLIEIVRAVLILRGGYDLAKAAPIDAVSKSRIPICFFHGERDNFVAPYMAGKLLSAAGGAAADDNKQLTMIPNAGHAQSVLADPDRYYGALFHFVECHL